MQEETHCFSIYLFTDIEGGTSRFLPTSHILFSKYLGNGTESEADIAPHLLK